MEEFKEWSEDPISEKELIWTLPDLTSINRLKNFCRQIKKKIYQCLIILRKYYLTSNK